MLGLWNDRSGQRISRRAGITLIIASSIVAGSISYTVVGNLSRSDASACTHRPASGTSVLSGSPAAVAAGVARELFGCAPALVVANENNAADVAAAVPVAEQAHAPLLLSSPLPAAAVSRVSSGSGAPAASQNGQAAAVGTVAALREISDLRPRSVLAVGLTTGELSAEMPRAQVTTSLAGLAGMSQPRPLGHVVVLVSKDQSPDSLAATATAEAAGAEVIPVRGYDPRADPAAIAAISAARPRQVIAVGSGFGSTSQLNSRLAVVMTGVQLPGGGQDIVPMHRIVALYGRPGVPSLGALGAQGLSASIARTRQLAAPYRALSKAPVVPTFEIIASVATSAPGPDEGYSNEAPAASLRPWVQAAAAAGMYVILDLQPGRDSFLAQAKVYQSLLSLPNVGLALDPEWKLQPGQLPLHQIGSVSISEVNSVVDWLAGLTARCRLPQKLLVLHEFKIGEIINQQSLDTRHDDLAIVMDMDGQGTPAVKQQTWDVTTAEAPPGVPFGWKNFFGEDQPMLSPAQTMAKNPQPVMISYQ
jgi:putative cell wall-binding protein